MQMPKAAPKKITPFTCTKQTKQLTAAAPKTIDVWFAEQDAAVEAESKHMARRHKHHRRKFDWSEAQRRIDQRVEQEQERFALELAITRAGWKWFGTRAVDIAAGDNPAEHRQEMEAAYERKFPGESILEHDITRRAAKNNPNRLGLTRFDSEELCTEHELSVRMEIIAEMRREMEGQESEQPRPRGAK